MANEKKFNVGPSTNETGCTQASVSESIIDEDAIILTAASAFDAKSMTSNGDASRGLILNDADDAGPDKTVARPACGIGANPMHEGVAANAAIASRVVDSMLPSGLRRCNKKNSD